MEPNEEKAPYQGEPIETPKRKRGRPKGSTKKPVVEDEPEVRVKTKEMPEDPAAILLKKKWTKDAADAMAQAKAEAEANQYYLKCSKQAGHHAAYLTEPPSGNIHPGMWFNVHHKAGDPWTHRFIRCQECEIAGDTSWHDVHVKPIPRGDGNYDFALDGPRDAIVGKIPMEQRRKHELPAPVESEEEEVSHAS